MSESSVCEQCGDVGCTEQRPHQHLIPAPALTREAFARLVEEYGYRARLDGAYGLATTEETFAAKARLLAAFPGTRQ